MEKLLLAIKHNLRFLWNVIEWVNDQVFYMLFGRRMNLVTAEILKSTESGNFSYRLLQEKDIIFLSAMIAEQDPDDLKYFQPHGFDETSLMKQYRKRAFLMMGTFDGEALIGYFFLRFFANKKCFVGRIIDKEYRGSGIGLNMNRIMYQTAWGMDFRCQSTISKNNKLVMKAHEKNPSLKIIKELNNNYLLVEFLKTDEK